MQQMPLGSLNEVEEDSERGGDREKVGCAANTERLASRNTWTERQMLHLLAVAQRFAGEFKDLGFY